MARKVIIDCDPGIDDAVALSLALFDPRLEVVAVSAVAGNASARQSSLNAQAITEQLDPPRWPRIGAASPADDAPATDGSQLHGRDGLGDANFPVSKLHHRHLSDKLICDEVRAAADEVTILCLGPLTNVARALKRDPELETLVSRIVIAGGSVACGGNVTPAAEFNIYYDSLSARIVFRSATTKTLIPLDVTGNVPLTLDMMNELPKGTTRIGGFLRRILPFAFRAHHQVRGEESINLPGAVALLAVLQPELFELREMAGDVEIRGDLTKGCTVFDRRVKPLWRNNMEVAVDVDVTAVADCIVRGLIETGRHG